MGKFCLMIQFMLCNSWTRQQIKNLNVVLSHSMPCPGMKHHQQYDYGLMSVIRLCSCSSILAVRTVLSVKHSPHVCLL